MIINFDETFKSICREIVSENLSEIEWSERASSDYFYEMPFCGGFDRDLNAFVFGFYDEMDNLYSFKLFLSQIPDVLSGKITQIDAIAEDT
ncbi:MAG: hypothetical protein IJ599_00320 [Alphaproteobacteria bacterium]|nr:hypothetical protein [Alphaproteobacteria bacterium]